MADTKHLQPALTVVNVTLWQALSGKLSPPAPPATALANTALWPLPDPYPLNRPLNW